jgi:hypothetical protein
MPANPVEAGRKGGQSKSAAKLAAAKRNGFQKVKQAVLERDPECVLCTEPKDAKPPSQ